MLTKEALIADATIAAANIPDNVLEAIATLSQNDQKVVIGERDKELMNSYDALLEEAGFPRDKTNKEKTSDAIKRVANAAKEAKTESDSLKSKIAAVEKQISDGNTDPALKTKLADLETKLSDNANLITQLKEAKKKEIETLQSELNKAKEKNMSIRVEHEFSKALEGLSFKDEKLLSKEDRELIINAKKQNLLSKYDVEFIDDGKGGELMAFRDKATKNIVNNPANGLNPFTAKELMLNEIQSIINPGRNVTGIGKQPEGTQSQNMNFKLNAKNQVEADVQIRSYLKANGIDAQSDDFITKATELRKENNVSALPTE